MGTLGMRSGGIGPSFPETFEPLFAFLHNAFQVDASNASLNVVLLDLQQPKLFVIEPCRLLALPQQPTSHAASVLPAVLVAQGVLRAEVYENGLNLPQPPDVPAEAPNGEETVASLVVLLVHCHFYAGLLWRVPCLFRSNE